MMFVFGCKATAVRLQYHNILFKQIILLCFKTVTNNLFVILLLIFSWLLKADCGEMIIFASIKLQ